MTATAANGSYCQTKSDSKICNGEFLQTIESLDNQVKNYLTPEIEGSDFTEKEKDLFKKHVSAKLIELKGQARHLRDRCCQLLPAARAGEIKALSDYTDTLEKISNLPSQLRISCNEYKDAIEERKIRNEALKTTILGGFHNFVIPADEVHN